MNNPENNLITVVTSKEITLLYKTFLEVIEDIEKDNKIMLDKIATKTSPEFAQDINYFTPEKYERLRKRILDSGNECSRRLIQFLDFFEFIINKDKVAEAAKQRHVIKKFITSSPIELK